MPADPELAKWLEYFADLGYQETYRDRATPPDVVATASAPSRPTPDPERVARPPGEATPTAPARRESGDSDTDIPSPAVRRAELEAVGRDASTCTRCTLAEGRRTVVFGSGHPDADLMFIGEGPGAEEDRRGLPFVGPAGELLGRIISAIELTRDQVYIANIVKCRPPHNRDPQAEEAAACRPWLEAQIRLVRPRVVVALGRVAAQALLGEDAPIGKLRGRWHSVRGVAVMPTFHPAALLRNSSLKRPVWEDMQQVRERLRGSGD